jgi:hypothetical protein
MLVATSRREFRLRLKNIAKVQSRPIATAVSAIIVKMMDSALIPSRKLSAIFCIDRFGRRHIGLATPSPTYFSPIPAQSATIVQTI